MRIAVEETCLLDEALSEMWEQLLEVHNHEDYEQGEGGFGTMTFNVPENSVSLEHSERFIDSKEYVYAG